MYILSSRFEPDCSGELKTVKKSKIKITRNIFKKIYDED